MCVYSSDAVSVDDFTGSFLYERASESNSTLSWWTLAIWRAERALHMRYQPPPLSYVTVCVFGKKKDGNWKKRRGALWIIIFSAPLRRRQVAEWNAFREDWLPEIIHIPHACMLHCILCQTTLARINWSIVKICIWNTFAMNWELWNYVVGEFCLGKNAYIYMQMFVVWNDEIIISLPSWNEITITTFKWLSIYI